jgi:hypothetical protein
MTSSGKTVVVSQSMYFPWCGLLDQIRLADVFVHYDDVQLSRGFYSRVQIKTPQGTTLITVPLMSKHQNQLICESYISYESDWIAHHRSVLLTSYRKTKFIDDAIALFDHVHSNQFERLSELGRASIKALSAYFQLDQDVQFLDSARLGVLGASSQRLLDITKVIDGQIYLTGHGALNYLDHALFEKNGVEVRYMDYSIEEYPQVFGTFTPYVTSLDAVAHLGPDAMSILKSTTVNWREANERPEELRA